MIDWFHALPPGWMAVVVFGSTFLVAAAIQWLVQRLAVGERARTFKAVSTGLLSPLGIIFGLMVAFLAAQVWGDVDRAHTAVNREASALRTIVVLGDCIPGASARLRGLVRQHIEAARTEEWPAMAEGRATLTIIPAALVEAMQATLALPVQGDGQVAAQWAIVPRGDDDCPVLAPAGLAALRANCWVDC